MSEASKVLSVIENGNVSDFKKFEMIEHYSDKVESVEDILQLMELFPKLPNPILRHEISAQLLRLEQKKSELTSKIRDEIEDFLIEVSSTDESIVSKHEALESLSYLGTEKSLNFLKNALHIETNLDIVKTIEISIGVLEYKLDNKIKSGDLYEEIYNEAINNA